MTRMDALFEARRTGKAQWFDFNDERGFRCAGWANPCGCLSHTTVLSDGSLGIGSWLEPCCIEHID